MNILQRLDILKSLRAEIVGQAQAANSVNAQFADVREYHLQAHNEWVNDYNEFKFFWQRSLKHIKD